MIDREKVISDLRRFINYPEPLSGTVKDALELLKEPPTIGGWISVKENLPKVSGHYLVSCVNNKTGHRWQVSVNAEWLTSRHDWYIGTENCLASAVGVTVTHYMPLPEPPKECVGE